LFECGCCLLNQSLFLLVVESDDITAEEHPKHIVAVHLPDKTGLFDDRVAGWGWRSPGCWG
jgi:hypothetical protein